MNSGLIALSSCLLTDSIGTYAVFPSINTSNVVYCYKEQ